MLGWLTPVSHHLYKGDIPENLLKHSERAQISAHSHSSNLLVKWCGSDSCDKYHRQLLGRVPRKPTVVYFFVSSWISSETIYIVIVLLCIFILMHVLVFTYLVALPVYTTVACQNSTLAVRIFMIFGAPYLLNG